MRLGHVLRSLLFVVATIVSGCAMDRTGDPCAPVDVGGECFVRSEEAFVAHALESADAWPQLDGMELSAERVIGGTDVTRNTETWVVPLLDDEGQMVAISRFVPVGTDQAKLGEVALLEDPLPPLPDDLGGELVLFESRRCPDDPSAACLFVETGWAIRLPDGRFRLSNGEVLERLS